MRYPPSDEYDQNELKALNAEDWMIKVLDVNPGYNSWGPYEDYMSDGGSGWNSRMLFNSWSEFTWELNDLNEIVNFYFEIERAAKACEDCGQTGYNPETRQISEDWYDFERTGRKWNGNITQDEVQALVDSDRLHDFTHTFEKGVGWKRREDGYIPTAEEVNEWSNKGIGHDTINHHVCVNQRAKRLGVYGLCPSCEGEGYVYTEPAAKLGLVLWVIHPRKGCSRGIHIKDLKQKDVVPAMTYLTEAMDRNRNRFSGIAGYMSEED